MRLVALFLAEALVFLAATINIRACAKGWIKATLATDGLIAGLNFTLIVWIAEATNYIEQVVYVAGAMAGSYLGMLLTKKWEENE